MRILNQSALAEVLSHEDCIAALVPAMKSVSAGDVEMPLRQYLQIPETAGKFTVMPGYLGDPRCFGVKLVSKYPRETDSPYGSHVGAVMLFDAEMGIPIALMDGSELTAIRTAAASALATKVLARPDSTVLTILGTGLQALHHALAIATVRPLSQVRIWGRNPAHAQTLCSRIDLPDHIQVHATESLPDAVAGADIVCTTTSAKNPILFGSQLETGQHLNLVGAAIQEAAEVDTEVVKRGRYFVDSRTSARAQAGELAAVLAEGIAESNVIIGELGELLSNSVSGRSSDSDITIYKSLGVAAQDLAAAVAATAAAEQADAGVVVDWS